MLNASIVLSTIFSNKFDFPDGGIKKVDLSESNFDPDPIKLPASIQTPTDSPVIKLKSNSAPLEIIPSTGTNSSRKTSKDCPGSKLFTSQ